MLYWRFDRAICWQRVTRWRRHSGILSPTNFDLRQTENTPYEFGDPLSTPIAVVVLAFNEEANLEACLDSVKGWSREVFVVDSYSTDRTVDIALSRAGDGVRVVQHSFEDYSKQWNWALRALPISAPWTLKLDADERVTLEFKAEVEALLKTASAEMEGVYFRRRFHFMGRKLRWLGEVGYDLRLWRTGKAVFEDRSVNEHVLINGRAGYLKSYVDHYDYKSTTDWIGKHNRYASLEAREIIEGKVLGAVRARLWGKPDERRMWLRLLYQKLPAGPGVYFLYLYFIRLGFLDGRAGMHYCLLRAQYFFWIDLKFLEYKATGRLPDVVWPMRGDPHPAVAASGLQRQVDGA